MTVDRRQDKETSGRVARFRRKAVAGGTQRVEVSVPADDVMLVKAMAGALREGGAPAERLRAVIGPMVSRPQARTGAELLRFLRASPLCDADIEVERDRSKGRSATFE